MWMGQGADTLSVGCVLVRVLFQTVKHLFLAAKQWQFVSELWREVGPRQRGKGLTQSRSAQRGCRGTDACLSLCLRCRFMERLSPLWRVFFVRGRVHENPQEFFGKRNFALLIVVYRSPFGIVRESVPLARTLAACPAPGGAFLCGPPRSRATDDAAPRWGGGLAGHPARDEQPRRHGPNGRQAHSSMCKSCTVQPTVLLPLWGLPPRGKPPFGR